MKSSTLRLLFLSLVLPGAVLALPEPDHTIHGQVSYFGQTVADGTRIRLVRRDTAEFLADYFIGSDEALTGGYALRVPMTSDPGGREGHARPGDVGLIYVGTDAAAEVIIGDYGRFQLLDLDPAEFGELAALTLTAAGAAEGDEVGGIGSVVVSLAQPMDNAVAFQWATQDGTALGGACPDADYASASGDALIAAGETEAVIEISFCGDLAIEADETLFVQLSEVVGASAPASLASVSIINDDFATPRMTLTDILVLEPQAGEGTATFTATLSDPAPGPGAIEYRTEAGSALAGTDFVAVSGGSVAYEAGDRTIALPVTLLADGEVEPDEQFSIQVTSAGGLAVQTSVAQATIIDPAYDPDRGAEQELVDGANGVDGLKQVSALVLSTDNARLYAAGTGEDALAEFTRGADGRLTFVRALRATDLGGQSLDGIISLAASATQPFVYGAIRDASQVAALIDSGTASALSAGPPMGTTSSLAGVTGLALAPDGAHLYAAAEDARALNVFAIDAVTGKLTLRQTLVEGEGGVTGLDGVRAVAAAPDGAQVLSGSRFGSLLTVWQRTTSSSSADFGRLAFQASQDLAAAGTVALADLAISDDGRQVYVVGETSGTLAVLDRAVDGALSLRQTLSGMSGPRAVAVTADGLLVVVAEFGADRLSIFERDTDGDLRLIGIREHGEPNIGAMDGPVDLAFSDDGKFLYVASSLSSSITVFERFKGDLIFFSRFE